MADENFPTIPRNWPDRSVRPARRRSRQVDARELRKRYNARSIRRFKPEHFPEQFRRIREAYDRVLAQVTLQEEWRSMTSPAPSPAPRTEPPPPPLNLPPPVPPVVDPPISSRTDHTFDPPNEEAPKDAPPQNERPEEPEIFRAPPETWAPPPPKRTLASELERLWTARRLRPA